MFPRQPGAACPQDHQGGRSNMEAYRQCMEQCCNPHGPPQWMQAPSNYHSYNQQPSVRGRLAEMRQALGGCFQAPYNMRSSPMGGQGPPPYGGMRAPQSNQYENTFSKQPDGDPCAAEDFWSMGGDASGFSNASWSSSYDEQPYSGPWASVMAVVLPLVETQMTTNMNAQGIIMDGFPRDMEQVKDFEEKFKQQPVVVLLDCSKLQLGRGRVDDSVAAFRKRLEIFREQTLPMLKNLDQEHRLQIVDGDTDLPSVQDEFSRLILTEVERLRKANGLIVPDQTAVANGDYEALLQDLETEDEEISTISKTVAAYNNNHLGPGRNRPSRDAIRDMYAQVETYRLDSNM